MNSPALKTTTIKTTATTPGNSLSAQLRQIGLCAVPAQLDDFIAHATKSRWSAHQILEQLVKAEGVERSRRSLERRLRISGIKSFKPMADFDWAWPAKIEREVIERALTLDFLGEARNLVMVGRNGLGKTMIAQNLCHTAVLAGHSVLFRSAAALLEDLHRQSPEGRRRKLRTYANVGLLCIDEVGYLSFDDKAADLLYESSTGVTNASRSSSPPTDPSRNGMKSSPVPLASSRCWIVCCITPGSRSLKAIAIACARASRKPRPAGGRNERHGCRKPDVRCCGSDSISGSVRYAVTAQPDGSVARQPPVSAGGALEAGGVRFAARHFAPALQAL
jgi:DNA replication protein DnaC